MIALPFMAVCDPLMIEDRYTGRQMESNPSTCHQALKLSFPPPVIKLNMNLMKCSSPFISLLQPQPPVELLILLKFELSDN